MLIAFELLVEASEENKLDEFINNPKLTRNTASPESVSHNTPSQVERIETFQTTRTGRGLNTAFNLIQQLSRWSIQHRKKLPQIKSLQ